MARQPIHDRAGNVFGYELLYRRTEGQLTAPLSKAEELQSLLNAAVEIGLDRLVGDRMAFFNLSPELLFDERTELLPPNRAVFELLENSRLDAASDRRIRELRSKRYRVAYDDFTFLDHQIPFVGRVDLIKVDVADTAWEKVARNAAMLKSKGTILLAEKVEDRGMYDRCFRAGFDLFQGYYFSRPQTVAGRRVSANQMATLRLIRILSDPNASAAHITEAIAHDSGLTSRVLAFANSSRVGAGRRVDSLHVAVQLLGIRTLQALATLLAASATNPNANALSEIGFIRAKVCEGVAQITRSEPPQVSFTVGLLSVLSAMMSVPVEGLITELGIGSDLAESLKNPTGHEGLRIATAIERGDWKALSKCRVPAERLSAIYWRAVEESAAYRNRSTATSN